MTSSVHQAREAFGHRLRDIRRDAGFTGRQLAGLAGWHSSKVSKIEYGKQTPSEDDIRTWCRHTGADDQIPDLIATVRHIEAMYVEWRRMLGTGTRRRQKTSLELEAQTRLLRWYEPLLIPGILHTVEYATAVMRRVIDFYQIPDDLDAGVAARMERQQILYRGDHRFHFIIAHQALLTTVGDADVMIGQLDRLRTTSHPRRIPATQSDPEPHQATPSVSHRRPQCVPGAGQVPYFWMLMPRPVRHGSPLNEESIDCRARKGEFRAGGNFPPPLGSPLTCTDSRKRKKSSGWSTR